ncbi:unnamed protein product, partial [Mesorhabditis spiculigera]
MLIEKEGGTVADALAALSLVRELVPIALQVLGHEEAEISELVIDFIRSYVLIVNASNEAETLEFLKRVVQVSLRRYTMPFELEPDGEGEDEIKFHEYRTQLRSLINPIGTRRPQLVVEPVEQMVAQVLSSGKTMNIRQVEATIQLVYSLADMIPANFPNTAKDKDVWLVRAAQLPLALLDAVPLDGRSKQVHIQYFENVCRYEKLVGTSPNKVVPHVAAAFLDERGLGFPSDKVRSRIAYLFVRFVKAQKQALSPLVSEMVPRIAPILAPGAVTPLSPEDQGFLFEVTATLIVFGNLEPQQKRQFFEELIGTVATRFQQGMLELQAARQQGIPEEITRCETSLTTVVSHASRLSKAFSKDVTMNSQSSADLFMNILTLFLDQLTPVNAFLLENIRQLTNRLVVCIEQEMLRLLPRVLGKFSECSSELDQMHHLLILCHQVVTKYKKSILHTGSNLGTILSQAARFASDPEVQAKFRQDSVNKSALLMCQRSFAQFLYAVVVSETLQDLAPGEAGDMVLESARRLAFLSDTTVQKQAIMSLAKCAIQSITHNGGRWYQPMVRTILEIPTLPHLAPTDAGSQIVLHECASGLQSMREAAQPQFDQVVAGLLPGEIGTNLIGMLSTLKGRELDKALTEFYSRIRSQQQKTA